MADTYLDIINRREVSIQQYATHLLDEYGLPNLDEAYRLTRLILLDYEEITSRTKLNKILTEINKTVTPVTHASNAVITAELGAFGFAEATFAANTLAQFIDAKINKPAKTKVIDYIERSIMSLESGTSSVAGVWSDFVSDNTDELTKTINSQVIAGYGDGETTAAITRRIKVATQGISKNAIERLVRTGTAHYAQQANNYFRDDNIDVLDREYPITTWDSRRSDICTSIEAKYGVNGSISSGWPVGKSPIGYNPYHYQCRTIIRALPKGMNPEGERPAIEGKKGKAAEEAFERKKDYAEARDSTVIKYTGRNDKAFSVAQISVNTKLSKFIKEQPIWYQNQLLGVTKAQAFRAGKLDLSNLTDKQLRPKTLAELELEEI